MSRCRDVVVWWCGGVVVYMRWGNRRVTEMRGSTTFANQNRSFPKILGNGRFQFCSEKWNCPIRGCHFLENCFVNWMTRQQLFVTNLDDVIDKL